MMNYTEIVKMFTVGLISKAEANRDINIMNMGSDTKTYELMK